MFHKVNKIRVWALERAHSENYKTIEQLFRGFITNSSQLEVMPFGFKFFVDAISLGVS